MHSPLLYFNGIDGDTGNYALAPRRAEEFSQLLSTVASVPELSPRPLKFGHEPFDLADSGWGVIWGEDVDPKVREALQPLLARRREQASVRDERYFRELDYYSGESTLDFWRRYGLGPDLIDPARIPYYLLLVGEPSQIPFQIQCDLQVPCAVGRISFDDPQAYADYVQCLLAAEENPSSSPPSAAFFGVENPEDPPTQLSVEHLVRPLEQTVAGQRPDWRVRTLLRQAADKRALDQLLRSPKPPDLLFTASHALRYRSDSPRQQSHQGALLCSDYPGERAWRGRGPIPDDFLFSGEDVGSDVDLRGMVAFLFACYTAGTPKLDSYAETEAQPATRQPFLGRLPQRLLQRGASAVIGHVDLALQQSFLWFDSGSQHETFLSTIQSLLAGAPVGHAMDPFGQRLGAISNILAETSRSKSRTGREALDLKRFQLWASYQDARNYIVLGDPAARLRSGMSS